MLIWPYLGGWKRQLPYKRILDKTVETTPPGGRAQSFSFDCEPVSVACFQTDWVQKGKTRRLYCEQSGKCYLLSPTGCVEEGSSHLWRFPPQTHNCSLIISRTADRPQQVNLTYPPGLHSSTPLQQTDNQERPRFSQTGRERGGVLTKRRVGPGETGIWPELSVALLDLTHAHGRQCRHRGRHSQNSHSLWL